MSNKLVTQCKEEEDGTMLNGISDRKSSTKMDIRQKIDSVEPTSTIYERMIGSFGYWQANVTLFYFTAYILTTFNNLGYVFQSANTDHQCIDRHLTNDTITTTTTTTKSLLEFSQNGSALWMANNSAITFDSCQQLCDEWQYNNSIGFDYTITSKFNLICGREWLGSFAQSMYQMGYVCSGLLIGWISDQYGRKIALNISIGFELLGGLLLILSPSIYIYILSRFILGFGDSGRGMCLYMILMETVGNKKRADVITGCNFGWIVGYVLLPVVAYLLRNYVYIQLIPTFTMALMAIFWLPYIPESPKWLLNEKQFAKSEKVLRQACRFNGTEKNFDENFKLLQKQYQFDQIAVIDEKKNTMATGDKKFSNFWQLLSDPKFGMITIILWFSFFVNGFIYHGFSLNIEIIGGNVFYNFALAGLIEIPSVVMSLIGLRYFGRRMFIICIISSATFCYATIATFRIFQDLSEDDPLLIILTMLGKMFIFATFNAIYIHAGEIFPTKLRQSGVSSCSISARFGSTIAPFVKDLTMSFGLTNTIIMFSTLSLASAIGTFFLPETKNRDLMN